MPFVYFCINVTNVFSRCFFFFFFLTWLLMQDGDGAFKDCWILLCWSATVDVNYSPLNVNGDPSAN